VDKSQLGFYVSLGAKLQDVLVLSKKTRGGGASGEDATT
jgi:hypothetical protein